jgi:hypothetical protein
MIAPSLFTRKEQNLNQLDYDLNRARLMEIAVAAHSKMLKLCATY